MSACLPIDGLLFYNTGIQRSLLGGYWFSFFILLASLVIWGILNVVCQEGIWFVISCCPWKFYLKILRTWVLAVHNKESLPQVVSTFTGYLIYMRSKISFLTMGVWGIDDFKTRYNIYLIVLIVRTQQREIKPQNGCSAIKGWAGVQSIIPMQAFLQCFKRYPFPSLQVKCSSD